MNDNEFDAAAARVYPTMVPSETNTAPQAPVSAEETRARKIYPSSAPQPKPPQPDAPTLVTAADPALVKPAPVNEPAKDTPAPTPADQITEHGITIPGAVVALRASDPERVRAEKMFGNTPDFAIDAAINRDGQELPETTRKAVAIELSKMTRDLGLEGPDTGYIVTRIAQLKSAPIAREVALRDALKELKAEFGDDYIARFNDAKKLAHRDPRVAKMLDATGLGNDTRTILILARRARSERAAGRLND